jgi:AraC family transcriptional regulator, regulatory protein of adaptative response / DNA-3-methyladenine glycosylase II
MKPDDDACYAAVTMRDRRYDGWFFVGVTSTGIYCRPSCPARTPKRTNARFYPTAAAAQGAGFRACRRCRPDAVPGSPAYDHASSVTAAAVRLVDDGYLEQHGVSGLATRLGYSERQLNRIVSTELGSGPLQLARARRAHAARVLIQTTTLGFSDIAFAAGFGSIRQFNDTLRDVFAATPTELRAWHYADTDGAGNHDTTAIHLRLAYRAPFHADAMWKHLALHLVPGLEELVDGSYRRALALPRGTAIVELTPGTGHIEAALHLADLRDLTAAVAKCRRLLDLDADPVGRDAVLRAAGGLTDLLDRYPGLRIPGSVDGFEVAVRAVLGQQVSLGAGCRLAALLAAERGTPVADPTGGLTHAFPTADQIASAPVRLPMPASRNATIDHVATAVVDGRIRLDAASDPEATAEALQELPGIGRWTTDYLRLRGLGDPDVYPSGDLVLRRAAEAIGLPAGARPQDAAAEAWRPLRSLAAQLLWTHATYHREIR